MRMEELSWETSETADVCAQGDLGQVANLFDYLFGIRELGGVSKNLRTSLGRH